MAPNVACNPGGDCSEAPLSHRSVGDTEPHQAAREWLDDIQAIVEYDEQGNIVHVSAEHRGYSPGWAKFDYADLQKLEGVPTLRSLDLFYKAVTDERLRHVAGLSQLRSLNLRQTKVTDAGMKRLRSLRSLEELDLEVTEVADDGLRDLADLKNLKSLNLTHLKITDEGAKTLSTIKSLQRLNLYDTEVTDGGLVHLGKLSNLHSLNLGSTKITNRGAGPPGGAEAAGGIDSQRSRGPRRSGPVAKPDRAAAT